MFNTEKIIFYETIQNILSNPICIQRFKMIEWSIIVFTHIKLKIDMITINSVKTLIKIILANFEISSVFLIKFRRRYVHFLNFSFNI